MTEFANRIERGVYLYADQYGTDQIATPAGVYAQVGPSIHDPTAGPGHIWISALGKNGRIAIHVDPLRCKRYEHWLALAVALGHSPA